MNEPDAQSTDPQDQIPTQEAGGDPTNAQGAEGTGGTREYMQQILEAYPEDVREQLNSDLQRVHDRAHGTSGHQVDVLRQTVEQQQQTNLALQQAMAQMAARMEQVAETTTAQSTNREKAQLAAELGITPEEVDNLTNNLHRLGFVRKSDIPDVEGATRSAAELAAQGRISKDLDIWSNQFGENFGPLRELFEAAAPELGYDFTPLQPQLAKVAKWLQQMSQQGQLSEQERKADRRNAATTQPSSMSTGHVGEIVYDPQGRADWQATFRSQPEE